MELSELRTRLRPSLDPSPEVVPAPGDRLAGVLVPLVASSDPALILVRRAASLSRHAGEIAFPGGLVDEADAGPLAAALREAEEEVGLDPGLPEILGALPPVHTTVSGILVVPFVGMLAEPPRLSPGDDEIAEVFEAPVRRLLEVEAERTWDRPDGRRWTGWVYELEGRTVWGATGRMVHELLEIWRREVG
ncbi:putative Nudix hydrolase NudL [bacterium HR12]|nr:putative Nudix hydrolase NudL [bacterium HR12]